MTEQEWVELGCYRNEFPHFLSEWFGRFSVENAGTLFHVKAHDGVFYSKDATILASTSDRAKAEAIVLTLTMVNPCRS